MPIIFNSIQLSGINNNINYYQGDKMKIKTNISITSAITPLKLYDVIDLQTHYSGKQWCWIIDDLGYKNFVMLSEKSNLIGDSWELIED